MTNQQWYRLMKIGERLGCHQMPERSFFYKGFQFPVCARCTGVVISSFVAFFVFLKKRISIIICFLLSGVMFLDWFLQYKEIRESTNFRRLVTGLIGGFGYSTLHLYFYRFIWNKLFRKEKKLAKQELNEAEAEFRPYFSSGFCLWFCFNKLCIRHISWIIHLAPSAVSCFQASLQMA